MLYEATTKNMEKPPKKIYRFKEEDIDENKLKTSMGKVLTLSDLFDLLLNEVGHYLIAENMDPLIIPDGVHKILNALVMSATLDIDRISVHNLSKLARKRPFEIDYTNRIMTVSIPISFIDVKVFTDYKINAGIVVISEGRIMGRAGDISLVLRFDVDFNEHELKLREFDIPTCQLSVTFKGEGLTKYLLNVLTPIVIILFKAILLSSVKSTVSKLISDNMQVLNRVIKEVDLERKKQAEAQQASTSEK